jgi:formiminoglutamase
MPFHHLIPPDETLFFSRNDPDDQRLGDLTTRDPGAFPGDARVALVGVPQDIGVERNGGRIGASEAPDAIRRMLYRLTPYNVATGRSIPPGMIRDLGNIHCAGDLEDIHARLSAVVEEVVRAGVIPIVLGGGHDTTYGAATGVASTCGPLGMINVDAHLDVRLPNPLRNSGTSFRMLIEEGSVRAESFVELGIQPYVNSEAHVAWLKGRGARIITIDEVHAYGAHRQIDAALQIAKAGTRGLYGTLDIDGVRAAEAPGVSAPLPDGLTAGELLEIASALGRCTTTVALDVVEVNPRYDRDNATARLAAHAIVRFIGGVLERGSDVT